MYFAPRFTQMEERFIEARERIVDELADLAPVWRGFGGVVSGADETRVSLGTMRVWFGQRTICGRSRLRANTRFAPTLCPPPSTNKEKPGAYL